MIDITIIDIKRIDSNGHYTDNKGKTILLKDQDILALRTLHNRSKIASNRCQASYKISIYNEDILKKKKNFKRDKKKGTITKRWLNKNAHNLILRGLFTICLAGGIIGSYKALSDNHNKEIVLKDTKEIVFNNTTNKEEKKIIKKYCDIYQIDYNTTYELLVRLTNDFHDKNNITGIKFPTNITSEEELLLLAIRKIKKDPEHFSLSKERLYINNGYTSKDNYYEQIEYYSKILNLDECLIAAIVQVETGFDSETFNEYNNPANLKNKDDTIISFANKEEGIIELCIEVINYYKIIGKNKELVNDDIITSIGIALDNNEYWAGNIIKYYRDIKDNYNKYFI